MAVELGPFNASFDRKSIGVQGSDKAGIVCLKDRGQGGCLRRSENETEIAGVGDTYALSNFGGGQNIESSK